MSLTSRDSQVDRLEALWDWLDECGAVVRRIDVVGLPEIVLGAMLEREEKRVRVIKEGLAAGWHPNGNNSHG